MSNIACSNTPSIRDIIDQKMIAPHFQSIVDLSAEKVFGYESLVRSGPGMPITTPDQLFAQAQEEDCILDLDQLCVFEGIRNFRQKQLDGLAFINVLPATLAHLGKLFGNMKASLPLQNIVLEISEKYPLGNFEKLKESIQILRSFGALIAIDDLGAGYSGLKTWAEISPNFVKVDRHFIHEINCDSIKREFVRSILEIARGLRCQVIAEGVETVQQLEVLHSLGIKLGQGYFLHKPELDPSDIIPAKLSTYKRTVSIRKVNVRHGQTAGGLLEKVVPLSPDVRSEFVNDIFKNEASTSSIPIVDNNTPVGIVSRSQMLEIFSGRYSHQLYGNKPIKKFMNQSPIIVDSQTDLQEISKRITENPARDLNIDFIITTNNKYVGVGKVAALLEQLTNTQIRNARYSNPLTLLPGNVPIYEWIDELLRDGSDFWLAYFDINHFKPFNDHFGYSRGDEVITQLSEIIIQNTSPNLDMVGHIGGDDFVTIFRSNDWENKCRRIINEFEASITDYYSEDELSEKGIWCENRQGQPAFFRLLSLAVGAVNPDVSYDHSHHDIAALATDAKLKAKRQEGSHLFICRRRANKLLRNFSASIKGDSQIPMR